MKMVNEFNKPPPSSDNLNERMAASNRQLREMQEEHRQLVQEMEALRERANEFNRLSLQRQQFQREERENLQVKQSTEEATTSTVSNESTTEGITHAQEHTSQDHVEETPAVDNAEANCKPKDLDDDDDASAEFVKAKLAEIAALKAQYKRVQEMVQTTNLIEQHLAKSVLDEPKKSGETKLNQPVAAAPTTTTKTTSSSSSTTTPLLKPSSNVDIPTESSGSITTDPKEELLNSMLGMFTNISDDLRGQAESLRAERERIRGLKELLIQRRKSDSKSNNGDQR